MNKTPARYVFLGLLIGALFGAVIGAVNGNPVPGIQLGSVAGMFIGWILTAQAFQR
ncbi:MAG TPA: glycine zipper domain-containing protein [Anaerolineales bacterium]|nr:glycine zipper domain-containing protein [Anaerolineales bacterium]